MHPCLSARRHIKVRKPGLLMLLLCMLAVLVTAVPPQAAGLDELAPSPLQYYAWTRTASAESITMERARIAEDTLTTDPVISAVQLGLLLSAPALASPASEREALQLLEAALRRPASPHADPEYRIFAGFLRNDLQQRSELRLAEAAGLASQTEIDGLQESIRQLQDKISALTSIEEQLIQREQGQQP